MLQFVFVKNNHASFQDFQNDIILWHKLLIDKSKLYFPLINYLLALIKLYERERNDSIRIERENETKKKKRLITILRDYNLDIILTICACFD